MVRENSCGSGTGLRTFADRSNRYFIPILGYLDDLLIVPLGIMLAVRLIPESVMADLRAIAIEQRKPVSRTGLVAVLATWIAAVALAISLIWARR